MGTTGSKTSGTSCDVPSTTPNPTQIYDPSTCPPPPLNLPNSEWLQKLDPTTYHITREKGTEPPFTGKYYENKGTGLYHCACCDQKLFSSRSKYESGSGWPSFFQSVTEEITGNETKTDGQDRSSRTSSGLLRLRDTTGGMERTEIQCSNCGAHLGHEFKDGPQPTGTRFCVNSASLLFKEEQNMGETEEKGENQGEQDGAKL